MGWFVNLMDNRENLRWKMVVKIESKYIIRIYYSNIIVLFYLCWI